MMLQPAQVNIMALQNCMRRAGIPSPIPYDVALAWAASTWVNRLEVQAEALRLIGIELEPELYQEVLERARRIDATTLPN